MTRITWRAFLRSCLAILWESLRHPFCTSRVDLTTGRVVGRSGRGGVMARPIRLKAVRDMLREYAEGRLTLSLFHGLLVTASADVEHVAPHRAKELIYGAKLLLAEYAGGHRDEAGLRGALAEMLAEDGAGG